MAVITGRAGVGARARTLAVALVALWILSLVLVGRAWGAYGDEFGLWPINGHPDAIESVPALPGIDHAFWGGTCELASAPGAGVDMSAAGGIGERRSQILVPTGATISEIGGDQAQALVAAPTLPQHCIDWGAPALYQAQTAEGVWQNIPWGSSTPGEVGQASPVGDHEPAWRLPALVRAGAHPDATTTMAFNRVGGTIDGSIDNIVVDIPPGFVGNPQAVPFCTHEQFDSRPLQCPPESQVGVLTLSIEAVVGFGGANLGNGNDSVYPLYNLEPRRGRVAEIGFGYASGERSTTVRLTAKPRTDGDFGVTAFAGQIPAALVPLAQSVTLWGVPWAAANDIWRPKAGHEPFPSNPCSHQAPFGATFQYVPPGGLTPECRASYDASWGPIRPFLTNETDCNPAPVARLAIDSFQNPGPFTAEGDPALPPFPGLFADGDSNWKTYSSTSPAVTGCEELDFAPDLEFDPTSRAADSATGLHAELALPQNNEPPAAVATDPGLAPDDPGFDPADGAPGFWRSDAGRATAHLRDTVVTLPAGLSVNPSASPGLVACTDSQIGVRGFDSTHGRPLFNDGDPFDGDAGDGAECPLGSVIGTVRIETPLLADPMHGRVVLGQPKSTDPASGEMFRTFLVVSEPERGLVAKIFGSATADPATGQITTRFESNPELPFDEVALDLKGGPRALLALPQTCANHTATSLFTPWSGGPDVDDTANIPVDAGCASPFAPALIAGTTPRTGGASAAFELAFSRRDGEQWFRGVSAKLPQGLLASVRGVPLCANAQADAGACPAGSRIGSIDAGAGAGAPFFLERKGDVYLTEGYKGAPYGLMTKVDVEAGPFRGPLALDPIVIRQALHVDPRTAKVTAVSDPLPRIWHGIPLRVREVIAAIDRPGFVRNPTDCSPKQIAADIASTQGAVATPTHPFQAAGCAELDFEPKLRLRLTGRRQTRTGRHPGVRALVRQATGEAGIERARVVLPRSLALDPANARGLCEFDDGSRPDPENHCPKASIVGRARAVSPLLNRPLSGPVFFVKNIRTDPRTGNQIRTLPKIVVALRGEIAINLHGDSSVDKRNRLVNTFDQVPDAPVSGFAMRIKGGRGGILAVTRTRRATIDLCDRRQVARTRFDAHNDRRQARRQRIATPCPKSSKRIRCKTRAQRRSKACKRRAVKRKAAKRKAAKRRAGRRR